MCLERIKASGDIFMAYSDHPWILEGASVHVSLVGFDNGSEIDRELDGEAVDAIYANLTTGVDLTKAHRLKENADISFIGDMKKGKFEITSDLASQMLKMPRNPNGRPNSDVLRPWVNGLDITRRPRDMWIIDFEMNMSEADAALYEAPFEYIKHHVKPVRDKVRNDLERTALVGAWTHCTRLEASYTRLAKVYCHPSCGKAPTLYVLGRESDSRRRTCHSRAQRRLFIRCTALAHP